MNPFIFKLKHGTTGQLPMKRTIQVRISFIFLCPVELFQTWLIWWYQKSSRCPWRPANILWEKVISPSSLVFIGEGSWHTGKPQALHFRRPRVWCLASAGRAGNVPVWNTIDHTELDGANVWFSRRQLPIFLLLSCPCSVWLQSYSFILKCVCSK